MDGNDKSVMEQIDILPFKIRPLMDGNVSACNITGSLLFKIRPLMDGNKFGRYRLL